MKSTSDLRKEWEIEIYDDCTRVTGSGGQVTGLLSTAHPGEDVRRGANDVHCILSLRNTPVPDVRMDNHATKVNYKVIIGIVYVLVLKQRCGCFPHEGEDVA